MSTFDWSKGHWTKPARPCVHCRYPTMLRDDAGQPSHKVCAESA